MKSIGPDHKIKIRKFGTISDGFFVFGENLQGFGPSLQVPEQFESADT